MNEKTYLRLQPSEAVVCHMASRLLAAFIAAEQVNPINEDAMIERALEMAIKLAEKADRTIDSDNENRE